MDLTKVRDFSAEKQREILAFLKKQPGVSVRQLSRITGLAVSRVFRA